MRVLVIEDEESLRESLALFLRVEQYAVDVAKSYREGSELAFINDYDCILLDLSLPDGDGLALLKEMKKKKDDAAVIILTARGNINDRITGLNLGSDDYLTKPFSLLELSARMNAVLRRKFKLDDKNVIVDNLEIELDTHIAKINGIVVDLTKIEYNILKYLALNRNKTITRMSLAEHIWGDKVEDHFSLDFLNSHIKNLRKKLTESGGKDYLKTVYGVGYRFETE